MTAAIGYALAAMVLIGLNDFIFKQAARGPFKTHHFIMVQSAAFGVLVWLYALITHQIAFTAPALWGILAGCFMFTGFYTFALSLQHGSVSINAPIFRLSFIVTAVLAMAFLAEPATWPKLVGLALALVAIWLLLGGGSAGTNRRAADMERSLVLVGIATASVGIGSIVHKIALNSGVPAAMVLAVHSSVFLLLAVIVAVRADGGLVIPTAVLPYSLIGASVGAAAFITLMEALALAQASVVIPIAQMGLVVTAILGIAVLGEALTVRKSAGLAAAVVALWLLARG